MNGQPWRVVRTKDGFLFSLFHKSAQEAAKPHMPIRFVDIGIGMSHFEWTAREAGCDGTWNFAIPQDAPLPENYEFVAAWQIK